MTTTRFNLFALLRVVVMLTIPLILLGCEHSSADTSEVSTYMQENKLTLDNQAGKVDLSERPALTISPSDPSVTTVGDTVVLVAEGGFPPYEWGVGNSVIGSIQVKNGNPCTYIANQLKKNSVFVKDSRQNVAAVAIEVP